MPHIMPDRVADLIASQFPDHVRTAVQQATMAEESFLLCRTEFTLKAREHAISDMARANKVLAAFNPKLIVRGAR
ncbi:hypothetical protein ACFWJT_15555 [Streptomyces sp. NPDC127069]|uniref:hypothetical protein n=1 Tax=Streptomyces sp. NPDC127069 TaxID=3347128 RepID=UPI00364D2461